MGLLDFNPEEHGIPKPFTPPRLKKGDAERAEDNLSELNNLGRKKVAKDFSDSPHLK